jgi:hypothetical protein
MSTVVIVLIIIVILMALPHREKKEEVSKTKPKEMWSLEDYRYGSPKDMERSYKKGERLTTDEIEFMEARLRLELPACPDCESGEFLSGPEGGCSINIKCDNAKCGSKFNFMTAAGISLGMERISDASPDKPLEMVSMGPHR